MLKSRSFAPIAWLVAGVTVAVATPALAQLIDKTLAPNTANLGINKSLAQQVGVGRGNLTTPNSSAYIIARDPFRAIRRGRQIFQRKFTMSQGVGPIEGDGRGNINTNLIIGAGLADSCAACHALPRGSAGAGGAVVTRPDNRNAMHLFGLGLKEMLADEMTTTLRSIRSQASALARANGVSVRGRLSTKGVEFGNIIARPNGTFDTSEVDGVDPDLRVRPFFWHGDTVSIREFLVGAFNAEMGLEANDPELLSAANGSRFVTPAGMVIDGGTDRVEAPPVTSATNDSDGDGIANEIPTSIVDFMEFYLLNYFKPALGQVTTNAQNGRTLFGQVGCTSCHIPDFAIATDRRVADLETVFDSTRGNLNRLFATATPLFDETVDSSAHPSLKRAARDQFIVRNIYTDFKRHNLGPNFAERNFDGTTRTEFLTAPLWGVGMTAPYGHDGRSINLNEVILRHGGEALSSRNAYAGLSAANRDLILDFLNVLVLFPPDDTASTLDPGNRNAAGFPQFGHGSIALTVLFNNPADVE